MIDYQYVRYQEYHNSYDFDGAAYNEDLNLDSRLQPWGIPVRDIIRTKDVCVSYKIQDYSIVVPGKPNDGSKKEPVIGEFTPDGINRTFVDDVLEEATQDRVEDVVKSRKNEKGSGVVLGVSMLAVLFGFMMIL
jgi:hypothetical protein